MCLSLVARQVDRTQGLLGESLEELAELVDVMRTEQCPGRWKPRVSISAR